MSKPARNNDDPDVDPEEIEAASEKNSGGATAPEVSPEMESLTEWDTPLDAAGGEVAKVELEDEVSVAEELVTEGIEEADRDQRMAASDPDFEP